MIPTIELCTCSYNIPFPTTNSDVGLILKQLLQLVHPALPAYRITDPAKYVLNFSKSITAMK